MTRPASLPYPRSALGAVVALALSFVWGAPAAALTPGGGGGAADCLAEFGGTPANHPAKRPREIRCTDNDPACDDDPALGICRFRVEVCLNVTDPAIPGCVPRELEDYFVKNHQPDTNPRHDFDLQTLEDQVNFLTLPVDANETDVCSGEVLMNVRIPIRPRAGGGLFKRGRKLIRSTVSGPGGVVDKDRLRMTCTPADGATPCDDVTSTFDQIQRHVFTPTCAVPTCHSVAQGEHDLSLAPGDAHADLVGVPPKNAAAAAAGKLRVDPGNPANSFILDKLGGGLDDEEGERMPLELRRLHRVWLLLLEEWIAAGAPETGFVAPIGCH